MEIRVSGLGIRVWDLGIDVLLKHGLGEHKKYAETCYVRLKKLRMLRDVQGLKLRVHFLARSEAQRTPCRKGLGV